MNQSKSATPEHATHDRYAAAAAVSDTALGFFSFTPVRTAIVGVAITNW